MKKSVLALSVISALFLAGCSSDDDNEVITPDPVETKSISVSVNSNITKETVSADIVYPVNPPNPEEVPLAQVYSETGYPHFLRTNDYQLCVVPSSAVVRGEACIDVIDLTDAEQTFEFLIDAHEEDVKVELSFTGEHASEEVRYYYTAVGSTDINNDQGIFEITAEYDPSYSYVTLEGIAVIDGLNSLINDNHFLLAQTKEADKQDDTSKGLYYTYIQKRSDIVLTARSGEILVDDIAYNRKEPEHTHYKFKTSENDGSVIIIAPDLGEPIVIEPISPVVTEEQVVGATLKSYDLSKGDALYSAELNNNGFAEPWIYPLETFDGSTTLSDYDFSFSVSGFKKHADYSTYMNIYLTKKPAKLPSNSIVDSRLDLYDDGRVFHHSADGYNDFLRDEDEKALKGEAAINAMRKIGDEMFVIPRIDGNKKDTNFIVRVNDDNKNAFEFTISDLTVEKRELSLIDSAVEVERSSNQ
ncbi:hypothetical protein J8L86_06955 [Shewanella sp. MMG014]|uniref:hypothetical protein n=1 Tax=Shewanella sp. MMG014 TaxID=2822691 RepID=UPI001B3801BF|nr:hypothetical protein [Shewanella sp. MMG014]MBQ4889579.1 hypothetical protein [Shewanella sp. MMG014]